MRNRELVLAIGKADREVLRAAAILCTVGAAVASAIEDESLDGEELTDAVAHARDALGAMARRAEELGNGGVS